MSFTPEAIRAPGAVLAAAAAAAGVSTGCFADRDPLPLDERVVVADYAEATSAGWRTLLLATALASEACGWSVEAWDSAAFPPDGSASGDFRPTLFSDVLLGSVGAPEPVFTQLDPVDIYTYQAEFSDWAFLGEGAATGTAEMNVSFRDEDGAAIPPQEDGIPDQGIVSIDVTLDVDLTGDVLAAFEVQGSLTLTDFESCAEGWSPWASGELTYTAAGLVDDHTFSANPREDDQGIGPLRWSVPHAALPPAEGDPDAALEAFVSVWPDSGEWVDVGRGALFKYSQAINVDFGEQAGPTLEVDAVSEEVHYAVPVDVWQPDLGVLEPLADE